MIKQPQSIEEIQKAIDLMAEFLKESAYSDVVEIDRNYLGRLCGIAQCQGGAIWMAYSDKEPVGLLIAVNEPNMWNLKQRHVREIMWYVKPEYRTSTLGGRLFKAYQEFCENLLEQGKIHAYFTTQMSTTKSIDLERRGFRFIERTYVKEKA